MYLAFVGEMEKQARLSIRRERDRKRKIQIRKDQLMIAYIKTKHPVKYEEARDYYENLNTAHPSAKDLRKTLRFKAFQAETKTYDEMVLKIPLINPRPSEARETTSNKDTTNHEAGEIQNHEDGETTVDDIFPDIDPATLISELPPLLIEEVINELREDPELASLMNEEEEYVDDDDIDIDIQDDALEKELFW